MLMNFGFTEEQELLRKTARDFLVDSAPMTHVREVMEDSATHSAALWKRMSELGWAGLVQPEEFGGAGLGMVELCVVLEELGRSLAPVPFLPSAIAGVAIRECGDDAQRQLWLPRFCTGESIGTLAIIEESGSENPEDLNLCAAADGERYVFDGRKLFVPDAAAADVLIVVARTGTTSTDGLGLFLVPRETAGVELVPMSSMDLLRPLYEVRFDGVTLPSEALLGGDRNADPKLARVLDRARVMVAAEMIGGAESCLEASVAYAKERVQFGKPIGVNQAIKHKCADMLFEVESAKSITYYAAWAAQEDNDEAALTAAMAKAYVSDAYRHCSAENIQIHGGVGFTWEYDCHLYFKRAKSDETWFGDGRYHREQVARMLEL
jgi:alkylation response protein AidB-like acyl-CoA dehydrogenase